MCAQTSGRFGTPVREFDGIRPGDARGSGNRRNVNQSNVNVQRPRISKADERWAMVRDEKPQCARSHHDVGRSFDRGRDGVRLTGNEGPKLPVSRMISKWVYEGLERHAISGNVERIWIRSREREKYDRDIGG